jgi:hypothetical protein
VETVKKAITRTKALAIFRVLFVVLVIFLANVKTLLAQSSFQGREQFTDVATIQGFERIFANVITVVIELAGVILFLTFIVAGFKYLTSSGDPKALEGAKGTLTHAIIGLIVLLLAFVILVIIQEVTGAPITTFKVRIN